MYLIISSTVSASMSSMVILPDWFSSVSLLNIRWKTLEEKARMLRWTEKTFPWQMIWKSLNSSLCNNFPKLLDIVDVINSLVLAMRALPEDELLVEVSPGRI